MLVYCSLSVRAIAFKMIQGGGTFLKMQGGREGLSDNYVMRDGGSEKKICKGRGGGLTLYFYIRQKTHI